MADDDRAVPASVDFPLRAIDEPESFSVIVFGDPRPCSLEQPGHFRADVIDPLVVPGGSGNGANIHGAAFGISLGDMVGDHLDLFEPLSDAQGPLGVPWYNVCGNHDMNFLSGHSSLTAEHPESDADETFERVFGPTDCAFQYGRAHFIVLDNVIDQRFAAMRDPGHRMSVHVGEDGLITANVFNSAEGDRVTMRIVPGSTASDSRKDSHYIWHASLPTDVPAGTHVIEVVHTDLYGRTVSAHHTIRIGAPLPIRPRAFDPVRFSVRSRTAFISCIDRMEYTRRRSHS